MNCFKEQKYLSPPLLRELDPIFCFKLKKTLKFLFWLQIAVVAWVLGSCIICINVFYLSTGFGKWLVHNNFPKVASVLIGVIVFPLMLLYLVALIYLTFRPENPENFAGLGEFTSGSNTPARELLENHTPSELNGHHIPKADMPVH